MSDEPRSQVSFGVGYAHGLVFTTAQSAASNAEVPMSARHPGPLPSLRRRAIQTGLLGFAPRQALVTALSIAVLSAASIRIGRAAETPAPPRAAAARVDRLGDPLPPSALLRFGTLRLQHPRPIADLVLSLDGKTVVTIGGSLIAWDAATGKSLWETNAVTAGYESHGSRYGGSALAFATHGRWLYMPSHRDEVTLWDVVSGQQRTLSIGSKDHVYRTVAVSPDGRRLALGAAEGLIVCDTQGQLLFEIRNNPRGDVTKDREDRLAFGGHYSAGWFSPDRKTLAVVTSDNPNSVRLVDSENGKELRRIALSNRLVRLAFSPDGKRIAATERDNAVRLYSVETGLPIWSHIVKLTNIYENYTSGVAFSPDGKLVALGATDHHIYFCDAATGEEIARLAGHHWYPWELAFTADGRLLYSGGWDGTIRRWDVASRKQLPPPVGVRGSEVVAASPDGQTLAYADDLNVVHLANAKEGSERRTLQLPNISYSQLAFSPDGTQLAAGGAGSGPGQGDVQVKVWDLKTGELVRRFHWPLGYDPHSTVEALSFSPDGKRLAAAVFRQSAAYVFDLANSTRLARIEHSQIYGLSFSPDGKTLATAGWDEIIRLTDTQTWKTRSQTKVDGRDSRMYAVSYSPEGGWVATAHMDGEIRTWNAADMKALQVFQAPGRFIYGALCASPDGLWLATGGAGGEISVWDPMTGKAVWAAGRQRGYVYTVGFGRDSRTLISGGDDNVGYLWDLRPVGKPPTKDPTALWNDLIGTDGVAAYEAMWALSETPTVAIALVKERAPKLIQPLVDHKEAVPSIPVRRVLSLLAQIGTPEAARLLKEWADRDSRGPLGTAAARR
jgi:WD40 repeat protein